MARDDTVYAQHILDAIGSIETYCAGADKAAFLATPMLQDAVIRQLEIIGEATKQLSKPFRLRIAHIPWSNIAGMRDKLIHAYFGVDLEMVWLTIKMELPHLKSALWNDQSADLE